MRLRSDFIASMRLNEMFAEAERRLEPLPTEDANSILAFFSMTECPPRTDVFKLKELPAGTVPLPIAYARLYRGRFRKEEVMNLTTPAAAAFLAELRKAIAFELRGFRLLAVTFQDPGNDGHYFYEREDGSLEFRVYVRYTKFPSEVP